MPALLPKNGVKSRSCPYCREVAVSLDGSRRVTDRSEPTELRRYFVLYPHMEYYYAKSHQEYVPLPPLKDVAPSASQMMHVIYPSPNSVISLSRQMDGTTGFVVCKVAHTDVNAELFWHLDNSFLGSTTDIHHMKIQPDVGYHRLTVVDNYGNSEMVPIIIK